MRNRCSLPEFNLCLQRVLSPFCALSRTQMQMFSTVLFNLRQRVAAIFKICESLLQQKLCVIS